VVRDGQIVVGEIMNVTLSVDHRVADGAAGAQFLQELTRLLEAPLSLLV
jgi:pyruvate dehydrogenase E2 component (dihydrolipoamide acetyltransferase)